MELLLMLTVCVYYMELLLMLTVCVYYMELLLMLTVCVYYMELLLMLTVCVYYMELLLMLTVCVYYMELLLMLTVCVYHMELLLMLTVDRNSWVYSLVVISKTILVSHYYQCFPSHTTWRSSIIVTHIQSIVSIIVSLKIKGIKRNIPSSVHTTESGMSYS